MSKRVWIALLVTILAGGALLAQNGGFNQSGASSAVGSGGGGALAHYLLFPAMGSCALPNYDETGTSLYCLQNQSTGAFTSSSDVAPLVNTAMTAMTGGGIIYVKNGTYFEQSLTQESAAGCTNVFYGVGIPPSSLSSGTAVQFLFSGESAPVWYGESGSTAISVNGVIFEVTPAALASVVSTNFVAAIWQRPDTGSSCASLGSSTDDLFQNIGVRFPTNQRGNEGGIVVWGAGTVGYDNVRADFDIAYSSLAVPVNGASGSFGLTTTDSSNGAWENFQNVYSTGYYYAYDFASEHTTCVTCTAIYSDYACRIGSRRSIGHPLHFIHFIDTENINGCALGAAMAQGTEVDFDTLDIEYASSGTWARTGWLTEANAGYSSGTIHAVITLQGTGTVSPPVAGLFPAGQGQNFQQMFAWNGPFYEPYCVDNFTRADGAVGQPWAINDGSFAGLAISSNTAVSASGTGGGNSINECRPTSVNMFAQATVAGVDSGSFVAVTIGGSTTTSGTYYEYFCSTSGGLVASRSIYKVVAGTGTLIAATSGNSGCASGGGDTLRLVRTGGVNGVTLTGYYNGGGALVGAGCGCDMQATDASSPITGGYPGIFIEGNNMSADAASNFLGGSLP